MSDDSYIKGISRTMPDGSVSRGWIDVTTFNDPEPVLYNPVTGEYFGTRGPVRRSTRPQSPPVDTWFKFLRAWWRGDVTFRDDPPPSAGPFVV